MSLKCQISLLLLAFVWASVYINIIVWTSETSVKGRDNTVKGPSNADVRRLGEGTKQELLPVLQHVLMNRARGVPPVKSCTEKTNFVFIKCMKTATETMATVIRRFGYFRNLSFLTPVKDNLYLGWPFLMNKNDYRPSSRGYSIIMEHSIFNRTIMQKLMPANTVYISIIREPFSHVKSTINYFKILEIINITAADPLSEYFHHLKKYEAIYQSPAKHVPRFCIPDGFSLTKNLLSHCLGMPLGFPRGRGDISRDPEAVNRYIEQLDDSFYLVMLVEYFHESLVLLKRRMCWTHYDILYKSVNRKTYSYKGKSTVSDLEAIYKLWSSADYQLYEHFNRTFWVQVGKESSDFFAEVEMFSEIEDRVTRFCDSGVPQILHINATTWSPGFSMERENCKELWPDLLKRIQARHEKDEHILLEKMQMGANYVPKHQALC